MANRAYLYSCDSEKDDDSLILVKTHIGGDEPYADSRWSMPFAWLFFFQVEDLRIGTGSSGLRFCANKGTACNLLQDRKLLILNCFPDKPEAAELLETLSNEARSWQGKYLHIDPSEVYEGDPEVMLTTVAQFIQAIETQNPQVLLELAPACESCMTGIEANDFKVCLIGALY